MITGFDCSDLDDITWENISPDFQFCIIKKSEGATLTDPVYVYRANYLKTSKLLHTFYHYFRPQDSVQAQLTNYLYGLDLTGCLPPVVDIEEPGITVEMVQEFLAGLKQATGRKPILYSYPDFLLDNLQGFNWSELAYLWVADYTGEPKFDYTIWQNSEFGRQDGTHGVAGYGSLDLNRTNLTVEQLSQL